MAISDLTVRGLRPKERSYKVADGQGLFVLVKPSGRCYWRFRYEFRGKSKSLALGTYPQVSLKEAREKRANARRDLESGIDPAEKRRSEKLIATLNSEETFEAVAKDWHKQRLAHLSEKYAAQVLRRLETDVFPYIGSYQIGKITAPELLSVLRRIENRNALVTTHTVRGYCSHIFRFAIALGKADRDVASDLRGVLKVPNRRHFTHLEEEELPMFLEKLRSYDGEAQTRRALQLLIYTMVRTSEMRGARRDELDFEKRLWRIPANRMKMREDHLVPLPKQVLEMFKEQLEASGNSEFLFPNREHPRGFMSENTMLFAIYRMGYHGKATGHGFRSTASTILNENGFNKDHIERQLAHADRDKIRATYNYAQYMQERREMMQWWADYLDRVRDNDARRAARFGTPFAAQ